MTPILLLIGGHLLAPLILSLLIYQADHARWHHRTQSVTLLTLWALCWAAGPVLLHACAVPSAFLLYITIPLAGYLAHRQANYR